MALPGNVTTRVVTGKALDMVGGDVVGGTITFTPSIEELRDPSATTILIKETFTATLDGTGAFSVTLITTDNAALSPVGWTYTVQQNWTSLVAGLTVSHVRTWSMGVPAGAGALDISTIAGQAAAAPSDNVVLSATVGQNGGPAGPLVGGLIPAGQIPGGGGGGGLSLTIFDVKGDIIAATGNDTGVRWPAGANNTFLTADSAQTAGLAWRGLLTADLPSSVLLNTLATTKGDLLAATASAAVTRLGVGGNDTLLVANSAAATGLNWRALAAADIPAHAATLLTSASLPLDRSWAKGVVYADKAAGVWPNRPTARSDIIVIWSGQAPGPTFGGTGALAGVDKWEELP